MSQRGDRAQPGEEEQAVARLDAALEGERRAQKRQDSARGASAEVIASADLHEAQEQVAAREAWMKWIGRDY